MKIMNNKLWSTVIFSLLLFSCLPETECDTKSLMLDESDFTIPVAADPIYSPLPNSRDSAGRTFYVTHSDGFSDSILHSVERYAFTDTAAAEFRSRKEQIFRTNEDQGPWTPVDGLDEIKVTADRYFGACGIVRPFPNNRCGFIAQYDDYFTFFTVEITEDGMTTQAFLDIITRIDTKISACSN